MDRYIEVVVPIRPADLDVRFLAGPVTRRPGEHERVNVAVHAIDAGDFVWRRTTERGANPSYGRTGWTEIARDGIRRPRAICKGEEGQDNRSQNKADGAELAGTLHNDLAHSCLSNGLATST